MILDMLEKAIADTGGDPAQAAGELALHDRNDDGVTMTQVLPNDVDRAEIICDQIAEMRFNGESNEDLGFHTIEILHSDNSVAAGCASAR
jgi:hypothetical protein